MNGFYWIYLVMFVLLLAYHFAGTKEQKSRLFCMGCGFLLILYIAQDYYVSGDTDEYMLQYAIIQELPVSEFFAHKFEIGFVVLNKLLSTLFESERILLLVMGIATMLPFYYWMEKETEEPMIALMSFLAVGMYLNTLIYIRQMFAMVLLLLSCRYIRQRKLVPFLLLVFAAAMFQKSSAVFVVVYIAYALPVNRWLMIGAAIGCGAMAVLGEPIMQFVNTYIYSYQDFFFGLDGGFTMLAVLWVFTLLIYWLMRERLEEPQIKPLFMMMLIAAVIQPVCFTFSNWCRIVIYFRIAMVLLIPELYITLFKQGKGLAVLEEWMPKLHKAVLPVYHTKWFQAVVQIAMFTILFAWYVSELDGAAYMMAPVVPQ